MNFEAASSESYHHMSHLIPHIATNVDDCDVIMPDESSEVYMIPHYDAVQLPYRELSLGILKISNLFLFITLKASTFQKVLAGFFLLENYRITTCKHLC